MTMNGSSLAAERIKTPQNALHIPGAAHWLISRARLVRIPGALIN